MAKKPYSTGQAQEHESRWRIETRPSWESRTGLEVGARDRPSCYRQLAVLQDWPFATVVRSTCVRIQLRRSVLEGFCWSPQSCHAFPLQALHDLYPFTTCNVLVGVVFEGARVLHVREALDFEILLRSTFSWFRSCVSLMFHAS